jgi:hypothetical protein
MQRAPQLSIDVVVATFNGPDTVRTRREPFHTGRSFGGKAIQAFATLRDLAARTTVRARRRILGARAVVPSVTRR